MGGPRISRGRVVEAPGIEWRDAMIVNPKRGADLAVM